MQKSARTTHLAGQGRSTHTGFKIEPPVAVNTPRFTSVSSGKGWQTGHATCPDCPDYIERSHNNQLSSAHQCTPFTLCPTASGTYQGQTCKPHHNQSQDSQGESCHLSRTDAPYPLPEPTSTQWYPMQQPCRQFTSRGSTCSHSKSDNRQRCSPPLSGLPAVGRAAALGRRSRPTAAPLMSFSASMMRFEPSVSSLYRWDRRRSSLRR